MTKLPNKVKIQNKTNKTHMPIELIFVLTGSLLAHLY